MYSKEILEQSSKICKDVIEDVISKIKSGEILDTGDLNKYGDNCINTKCLKVYQDKGIKGGVAFPTSISLNNCVSNYIYELGNQDYNNIKSGDVVKIELGVNLGGYVSILGETIIYKEGMDLEGSGQGSDGPGIDKRESYLELLEKLKVMIKEHMKPGVLNDDIRIMIESKCTEYGCFPVENTTSYEHLDGQLFTYDSKYIVLNYQKYYDRDDNLAVLDNVCFEFESEEVYTINLCIIPDNISDEINHKYIEPHEPHIYSFTDIYGNLRLKMSKDFYKNAKNKYGFNAFNGNIYKNDVRSRHGLKDCLENGVLQSYPVIYSKDKYPVFSKKFTLIVE